MKTLLIRAMVGAIMVSGALAAVMLIRTATLASAPRPAASAHSFVFDESGAVDRFAEAIALPTVLSTHPGVEDITRARNFHDFLEASFPQVHEAAERSLVGDASLLFVWRGSDIDLAPILLTAYFDAGGESPGPFDQEPLGSPSVGRAEGMVRGPGAMGGKGSSIAMLEAMEGLLASGFAPSRTVLLALAHDGATASGEGARELAETMNVRGLRPSWGLGEGFGVAVGAVPGVRGTIGVVGTAEVGWATIRTEAEDAEQVLRRSTHLFTPRMRGPVRDLMEGLAPHMDPGTRMLVANLWLLERPVANALVSSPWLGAMLHSAVMPVQGDSGVRLRIVPGDSPEEVVARAGSELSQAGMVWAVDPEPTPPSRISSPQGEGFHLVRSSIHRVFPDVVAVAPALLTRSTSVRHYESVAEDVYRFTPLRTGLDTFTGVSGDNDLHDVDDGSADPTEFDEQIRVNGYLDAVRFYADLIRSGAGPGD